MINYTNVFDDIYNDDFCLINKYDSHLTINSIINLMESKNHIYDKFVVCNAGELYTMGELNHEFLYNTDGFKHNNTLKLFNYLHSNKTVRLYWIVSGFSKEITFPMYDEKRAPSNFILLNHPTEILFYTYNHLVRNNEILDENDLSHICPEKRRDFKFLFACYNNHIRYHRRVMVDYLFKNNLVHIGKVSFNADNVTNNFKGCMKYIPKFWDEHLLDVDGYASTDKDFIDEFSNDMLYSDALIQLACETYSDGLYFTEKTYRPMLLEQIFIIHGCVRHNHHLLDMGFEMYDEIFDYSFDLNDNCEDRAQGICDNLLRISASNYNEIYDKVKPKILRNKNRAIELLNSDEYSPIDKIV